MTENRKWKSSRTSYLGSWFDFSIIQI